MGIKKVIAVACILVLGLGLAGYFVFSQTRIRTDLARKPENDSISMPNEAGTAHDESLSDTGASDTGGISVPGQDGVRKDEAKDMPVTAEGIFNGRIDSNFIEVELEDGAIRSFQLNDDLRESFDDYGFEPGDRIRLSYREREGQNPLLEKIEEIQ